MEQGAFIPGRYISENISLSQELFRDISGKVRSGNMVLKLDIEKAYDRVDWGFLKHVLQRFGFSPTWVDMVEKCWGNNWL
ncbi:reverse transcriptase domain-containing protein [Mycobacterium kansasii]